MERALLVLRDRWTLLILRDLLIGQKRFSELKRSLKGISPKTLTERLTSLHDMGIVIRTVYPEVPIRVEYSLTEKGRDLETVLKAMQDWSCKWMPDKRACERDFSSKLPRA